MVKPKFMPRDPNNISNLWNSGLSAPLEFLLDENFFWMVCREGEEEKGRRARPRVE
jgi:hypothetical protein